MNSYQRALRDFQDYVEDVSRARYRTFGDTMRRVASTLVPGTPLGDVAARLPAVDLTEWYADRKSTVGPMIGSGTLVWPTDRLERLALQVQMVRTIASDDFDVLDLARNFLYIRNDYDDHVAEFVQQIFRPFVRDFLRFAHDNPTFEAGLKHKALLPEGAPMADEELALFISHSSADSGFAKALVSLFEKGLKISARSIRCTSVDGYRLPAGADTNDTLRAEVFGAKVLVAVLTPVSLDSHYVLFELGARWGARRPLFPVLACGTEAKDLHAPLNGLNGLSAASPDQMRQLLEDTAAALSVRLEPMASFSSEVDAVVTAASNPHSAGR